MNGIRFICELIKICQPASRADNTYKLSFHSKLKKGYKEMRKASPEIKLLFDVADLDKSSVSQIDALNLTSQESEESF